MAKKVVDVKFSLQGAIREDRQTRSFVAYCPALDLYSAGKSRPESKKALTAAVDTYVRLCYDRGILGRLLKEKGFFATTEATEPDSDIQFIAVEDHASEYDDVFEFDIPLHLIAQAQAKAEPESCLQ